MPTLPLDHPDPLAATLGVMLYPGVTTEEREKAAAFPIKLLARAGAFKPEHAGSLHDDQLRALIDSGGGADTPDAGDRFHYGSAVGLMVRFYHALAMSGDQRASWATAQTMVLRNTGRSAREGISDSQLKQQRHRFMSVAHLWGAYAYRDFCFITDDRVGYDGVADFQSFLTESEIIRAWGVNWVFPRANATAPFAGIDMWRPPSSWQPPARRSDWPQTGVIPHFTLPEHLLEGIRTAGKPKPRPA